MANVKLKVTIVLHFKKIGDDRDILTNREKYRMLPIMPRKSRLDAPGAINHIIFRGIEKRVIFRDDVDYDNFLLRFGNIIEETETLCLAWALMPNHVHLLLRTGSFPISTVMRRLLTGYAQQFNRRHKRHGQLMQNRFKSFLCEEDLYLKELVRYIHLNPIRACIVENMGDLGKFSYTGHSAITGKCKRQWQSVNYVLEYFGDTERSARNQYLNYMKKGVDQGRRPELVGGGLIRSFGGWEALKTARRLGLRIMGDERILGGNDFVEAVLRKAGEQFEEKTLVEIKGLNLDRLINAVACCIGVEDNLLKTSLRKRNIGRARSVICYLAVVKMKYSNAEVARRLNISPSTVSKAITRGQKDDLGDSVWQDLIK